MSDLAGPPPDVGAIIRSKDYLRLLVLCAFVGLIVSLAAWLFLSAVPWIQDAAYLDLPAWLGFSEMPWWWPLPVVTAAGLITAFCIARLPGGGGGVPAEGLGHGLTQPIALPGVLLAALATLGLGLVLGPSAPVLGLGSGVALLVLRFVRADAPDQTKKVVAIAGTFAAFSMVFSSPLLAAIILIEAIGLGGATLPLILMPGLVAAGVGSIVYLGASNLSGLSTSAYALSPLDLPAMGDLSPAALGWTVALAVATPVAGFVIIQIGRRLEGPVKRRPFVVVPVAGLVVGGLAIVFAQTTGQPEYAVLFSGSRALSPLVAQATTLSLATLALLFVLKGIAWGISMGSFRGGPVFPAVFIGTVGGLLAADLPGFSEGAGVAVVMAALLASVLRLPLSSVIIAMVLTSSTGPQALPLIIIAAVISYMITLRLFARSETTRDTKESGDLASVPAASRGD